MKLYMQQQKNNQNKHFAKPELPSPGETVATIESNFGFWLREVKPDVISCHCNPAV